MRSSSGRPLALLPAASGTDEWWIGFFGCGVYTSRPQHVAQRHSGGQVRLPLRLAGCLSYVLGCQHWGVCPDGPMHLSIIVPVACDVLLRTEGYDAVLLCTEGYGARAIWSADS